MMKPAKSSAKIVWIYGAITGVCLFVILAFVRVLLLLRPIPIGPKLILDIILLIGPFLLVGMLASKQTGRVRTGTLAGLVAGLTGGIIFSVLIVWLMTPMLIGKVRSGLKTGVTFLVAEAIVLVLVLGLSIGIGAGIGALGGLIGKRKANVPPAGYPMYPPYSPQPQFQEYPPQQMQQYPPQYPSQPQFQGYPPQQQYPPQYPP